jgi:CheY-like chemotaxis protein
METPERVFRVMAIDDDEDDQMILERWVRRTSGAPQVQFVESGCKAVEILQQLPENAPELPHVILCDINMPGVDGFDFLRWIRASHHRQIPVVMRSSSPIPVDVLKAYELGANSYVVKRIGLHAMEQRLSEIVGYWRDVAKVPGH